MDQNFENKFRIIKKLVALTGEQAASLSEKRGNLPDILNLYHNLAVDYNILTTHYFNKKETDIFQKIKVTLLSINPNYAFYLEKI